MIITALLSDGVKHIDYDAASRTATVFYANGAIEYFQGVSWDDFSAVASSKTPAAVVAANFSKYTSSKGQR